MVKEIGIYKISNICNGKIYIGSSINLKQRQWRHFNDLKNNKHRNFHLQQSFNKYGEVNFTFEIIEYVEDKNELLNREQFWIDELNVCNHEVGYNICKSAESPMLGRKHSDSTKQKIGLKNKGNIFSDIHKNKLSNALKGRKISDKQRKQISEFHNGKILSQDTKQKIKENSSLKRCVINLDTEKIFNSITEASEFYNINRKHISSVCNDKRKTCGGYKWAYYIKSQDS